MAYQMKVDGMAEISELLSQMEEKAPGVAAQALYEGAGVMSAEIKKSADAIKTAPFHYVRGGDSRLPSPEEKGAKQCFMHIMARWKLAMPQWTTSASAAARRI